MAQVHAMAAFLPRCATVPLQLGGPGTDRSVTAGIVTSAANTRVIEHRLAE